MDFEDSKVARKYIKERVREQREKEEARQRARLLREKELEKKKREALAKKKREDDGAYGNIVG